MDKFDKNMVEKYRSLVHSRATIGIFTEKLSVRAIFIKDFALKLKVQGVTTNFAGHVFL